MKRILLGLSRAFSGGGNGQVVNTQQEFVWHHIFYQSQPSNFKEAV